jgi:hypothetical protein
METVCVFGSSQTCSAKDTSKPNAVLISVFIELSENDKREINERTKTDFKLPMYHAGQLSPIGTLQMKKGEKAA